MSDIKIEIKSSEVEEKEVTPKNGGDKFTVYEQPARISLNDEVRKLKLSSFDNKPYPPGIYQLTNESFYVDGFGSLKLGRLVLTKAA